MSAMTLAAREPERIAGLSCGPSASRRHVFLIEGPNEVDLLVRILTPFAIAGAKLAIVEFNVADDRAIARLQVDGLSQERAENLCSKPGYAPVFMGWCGRPGPNRRSIGPGF